MGFLLAVFKIRNKEAITFWEKVVKCPRWQWAALRILKNTLNQSAQAVIAFGSVKEEIKDGNKSRADGDGAAIIRGLAGKLDLVVHAAGHGRGLCR